MNFYFTPTSKSNIFASSIKLSMRVSRSCLFLHSKLSNAHSILSPLVFPYLCSVSLAFDCPVGYQQLLNTAQLQNRRECLNNSCSLESQSWVDNASQKASKHEAPVAHFNIMDSAKISYIPL